MFVVVAEGDVVKVWCEFFEGYDEFIELVHFEFF